MAVQCHERYRRQEDRKTERQKDRKTERQKDRKTERQKDRKTERQESNRRSIEIRQSVEFTKRGMKEERGEGWLSPQMWFHPHPESLYAAPVS